MVAIADNPFTQLLNLNILGELRIQGVPLVSFNTNIFNFDGTLTTDRVVAMAGFDLSFTTTGANGIGIGGAAVTSALLAVNSTTLGFLLPRLTTAERNAIVTPATGLEVYNTDNLQNEFFNGVAWVAGGASAGGVLNAVQFNNPLGVFAGDANLTFNPGGSGNLLLQDNTTLTFGSGSDVGMLFNGADFFINSTSGSLNFTRTSSLLNSTNEANGNVRWQTTAAFSNTNAIKEGYELANDFGNSEFASMTVTSADTVLATHSATVTFGAKRNSLTLDYLVQNNAGTTIKLGTSDSSTAFDIDDIANLPLFSINGVGDATINGRAEDIFLDHINNTAASLNNSISDRYFLNTTTNGITEAASVLVDFTDIGATTNDSNLIFATRANDTLTNQFFIGGNGNVATLGLNSSSNVDLHLSNPTGNQRTVLQGFGATTFLDLFSGAAASTANQSQFRTFLNTTTNGLTEAFRLQVNFSDVGETTNNSVYSLFGTRDNVLVERYSATEFQHLFMTDEAFSTQDVLIGARDGAGTRLAIGQQLSALPTNSLTALVVTNSAGHILYQARSNFAAGHVWRVGNPTPANRMMLKQTTGNFLLSSSDALSDTANNRAYIIDSAGSFIGGATDNSSTSAWSITSASGLVAFGTTVPTGAGLKANGVNALAVDSGTRRVAIGDGVSNSSHITSSQLSVISTTTGTIPAPRMTTAQKLAIATPATGLTVFDTDINRYEFFNSVIWVGTGTGTQGQSFSALIATANVTGVSGEIQRYNPTAGTFTITFPLSPALNDEFTVKNTTSDITSVTLARNGTEDIESAVSPGNLVTSFTLGGTGGESLTYKFDGGNWRLI